MADVGISRASVTQQLTGCDVRNKKVLVVGAGGIGCELIKNLVLTGFADVTMIDLDTIDYSNLNRQFLFRAKDVGRSKAEVARDAVLKFPIDEGNDIKAQHGNIKDEKYSLSFFEGFDICLNALDNVGARRHVNRVCLAANLPLIESGTQGWLGQVRAILKGKTQCYECDPPQPPKTYPVCTIRNHPDKPVHCIHWAKELLFPKLFGGEDTDLVDSSEGAVAEPTGEPTADGDSAATPSAEEKPASAVPMVRAEGESAADFAARVFATVFEADVERLLRMDAIWKERTPPTPIRLADLTALGLPGAAALLEDDAKRWSIAENASVFVHTIVTIFETRGDAVGSLRFDKDDPDALNLVTAAANLRSACFGIELKSRWDVKEIAGNIIPAIATTNAIIAGFIVLEAFKILSGREAQCRYCVCNQYAGGKKRDLILLGTKLDPPKAECYVCGKSAATLTCDTTTFTVAQLIEEVIKKHLSFNRPVIDVTSVGGDRTDQICEGDENVDADEKAKYERYRGLTFAALPVPIVDGATLDVEDFSQDIKLTISVRHGMLDAEKVPAGFLFDTGSASPQAVFPSAEDGGAGEGGGGGGGGGGDGRKRSADSDDASAKRARSARSDEPDDVDDCVMVG